MNQKQLIGLQEARRYQLERPLVDYLNVLAALGKTERQMADEFEQIFKDIGYRWQIDFYLLPHPDNSVTARK